MGHNRAGQNRKARLKRRKKEELKLAPKAYSGWVEELTSTWLRGEQLASPQLIARIRLGRWQQGADGTIATRRRGPGIAITWVDEMHYRWNEWNRPHYWINAETDGQGRCYFRRDARKIEVLEEFLHNTQESLNLHLPYPRNELHVKDFMMRHRRLLGINRHDTRILQLMIHGQMRSREDTEHNPLELPVSASKRIRGWP